jgi:hypothetical protein
MSKTPIISKPLKKRQNTQILNTEDSSSKASEFVSGAAVTTSPAVVKTSDKPAKIQFERKNFRFSKDEVAKIEDLKVKILLAGREKGQSLSLFDNEIARLGIYALSKLSDDQLIALCAEMPRGRGK